VLFLIITFIFSAFLLFFYELEFLGLALLIVYVGAIAILFLFVIMMVNEKTRDLKFEKDNNKLIFLIVIFFGMLIGSLF